MRTAPKLARAFRSILAEEGLLNLSQFDEPGFFDELPLYSRISQLEFLLDGGTPLSGDIDRAVIAFSLDYLDLLLQDARPRGSFLAALTFLKPSKDDPIVPSIFVCQGHVEERLVGRLVLDAPKDPLAEDVKAHLAGPGDSVSYDVLQDTRTVPGECRVFVGRRFPSNLLLLTIDELRADAVAIHDPRA